MHASPPATLSPLLALLGSVASAYLAAQPARGGLRARALRLEGDTGELELELAGVSRWVDGRYRIHVQVVATGPERTECRLRFPDARGLSRAFNAGLQAVAGPRLNGLLARHLGDAVQMEGERLVLLHAPLLRHLLGAR